MSKAKPRTPEPLRKDSVEARIIKQKVWNRMWRDNEHFMAAVVGREGSGKSYTALKIAEVADPTFDADRVMFSPKAFLERLKEWKANGETQGKVVVADEAGVGVGVRTWHDKDQILFNQVLQVIRDENMTMLFTIPRLTELDSQTRGRLHALLEMTDKENGEWAELKWLNWDPTRDERDKTYRHYPKLKVNGWKRKVKRLRFGPPSEDLVEEYSRRKDEFQEELYDEAIDEMEDDDEEEISAKEVAETIKDEKRLPDVVSYHNGHHKWQIDKDLIRTEFDISHSKAQTAKKLLSNDPQIDANAAGAQREGGGE